MLHCIGKRYKGHNLVQCQNISETPNDARFPLIYLCSDCANSNTPRHPRGIVLDLPDMDKPNLPELEASDIRYSSRENPADVDDMDFSDLEEIEL